MRFVASFEDFVLQESRNKPNFAYLIIGSSIVGVLIVVTFLVGEYLTAKMLLALEVAILMSGYLLYRGYRYTSLYALVGSMFVYELVLLTIYRDVPNIGLVWFLICPTLIASIGRPVDIVIWVPITIGAVAYSFFLVDQFPVMTHPMSLINLLGATFFVSIVSYRFVYDRRAREDQLTRALEKANAAEERSTRFLASMSHELRSPMTGIILSSEMLRADNALSEEARAAVERIYQGAQVTGSLLNDVLDLAKIAAKISPVVRSEFQIESLLADVFVTMEPLAVVNNTRLSVLMYPDCPADWHSNASAIRQILINLVSNAIKHTVDGEVIISTIRFDDHVDFRVTDTGAGIAQDRQSQIFEPFVRLTESTTHGTGLGLTLAENYAEILNCELKLMHSELGVGSQFCLSVPMGEYGAATVGERYRLPPRSRLNRHIVSGNDMRENWAVSWLHCLGAENAEDGELLDLDSGHILTTERLFEALGGEAKYTALARGDAPLLGERQKPDVSLGRCLICDDNSIIREVFSALLESHGYVAKSVADGKETLMHLRTHDFDFLLLDVQLGETTGIEVLNDIRQSGEPFANIPVCMISGSLLGREGALAVGADEYLLKPPAAGSLLDMAHKLSALAISRVHIN
ncbi:MAG: signal transduction histidine kinase/CheY-like chemotaxis protein [Candidatus Azotimanducaceae bacterium]